MATKSTAKIETSAAKSGGKKPSTKAPAKTASTKPSAPASTRNSHRCIVRWLDKTTGSRRQIRADSEKEAKEMVLTLEKKREGNPRYELEK